MEPIELPCPRSFRIEGWRGEGGRSSPAGYWLHEALVRERHSMMKDARYSAGSSILGFLALTDHVVSLNETCDCTDHNFTSPVLRSNS